MKHISAVAMFAVIALGGGGCASRTPSPSPPPSASQLRFSAHSVIEAAPVHYAIRRFGAASPNVPNGAIPALYAPGGGIADLAGHADTQALRHSLAHPDLRIILTVTQGHYRIVAKRSAGIRTMHDLRGKKIATVRDSSAAYYVNRALATVGLSEHDVEIVPLPLPPKDAGQLLLDGRADALALWDPEPEIAIEQLGKDAVILDPKTEYEELYNLHSTAAKLADPEVRKEIVRFVAKLIQASAEMRHDATGAIEMTARLTGYPVDMIRRSWPLQMFPATISPSLLDTLAREEVWLAARDGRTARTRRDIALLIDPSIEAEARSWLAQGGR